MSHGHGSFRHAQNRWSGGHRRRRQGSHARGLGVTTALSGLLGLALVVTTTPPAGAAEGVTSQAKSVRAAVQSLALALDALAATPTLQARLPLAGQSVSDVLGLDTVFGGSIGTAATSFTGVGGGGLADLVAALDAGGTSRGIDVSLDGSTITIALTGKAVTGPAYALHSDEDLFLDGTSDAGKGSTPLTGSLNGEVVLDVAADDTVSLDPASEISVVLQGGKSDLAIPSRYGFSDVTAKGSTAYDVSADFTVVDPDGSGAITSTEWQTTPFAELAPVTVSGSAAVDLQLDSNLVTGTTDGTVKQTLTAAQMTPTAEGDGSYTFGAPVVSAGDGLADLAKVTSGDAIVALSQMAAAYSNAQARIDPRLPMVDTAVSELGSAVDPLNKLIEAQGAAAVTCGRADSSPPAVTTVPGTTWYCQARTAEPIAGNVSWSVTGGGSIVANKNSAATVGPNPTQNIAVTGSAVEPEVSVSFDVTGPDAVTSTFTAQRRVRTAQELATRLSTLPGGADTKAAYDATSRALTFPISSDSDPAAKGLPYAFGDLFRPDARLRAITVDPATTLNVDIGKVAMAGTLGLLLEPSSTENTAVSVADRAFVKVATDEAEVSVDGISASGSFAQEKATGMVGMTKVALAGSDISLSTGTAPALQANIEATGAVADGAVTGAAMLSNVLAGQDDPATVETTGAVELTAAGTLTASADELPAGTYTAALDYPVDLADTLKDTAKTPTVTLSSDWANTLKPQDVAPQVTGTATGADTAGKVLTDTSANFLGGLLGPKLTSGDVVTLSLVNLRTGAQCSSFEVRATTLTCVEQGATTGTDLTPTWVTSTLAGGKIEDPAGLKTPDNFDNYATDNTWQAGDLYAIEGDPTAVRSVALGGLYDAADGIQRSEEPAWLTPVPLVGIAPKDLVPQLEGIRQAASEVNTIGDEARDECDQPGGCPATGALETAPADLTALKTRLATALKDHGVTGATTTLDVETVGGKPALVLDVTAPASGDDKPLALSFALGNTTDYWLRQAEGGTSIKPTWSSEVRLRIAVPTTADASFDQVKVLSGSGVTKMSIKVGTETVDLNAGLGPVDVKVGTSGALTGTAQDPEPNPVVRRSGTVTVAGTNTGTGTSLSDAEVTLANLAGTATKATRNTPTPALDCVPGLASGDGLSCPLPADASTTPATARNWASGDTYTLTYASTTWLTDTAADFSATGSKVVAGDLVRTYSGTGTARKTEGVCVVKTVLERQLECAAALTNAKEFSNGVTYQVLPNLLVDPGAGFADADLVDSKLTNTTTGASCIIGSATSTYVSCKASPTGGTRSWFEPGDDYAVAGASTLKADVGFTFTGSADALVPAYAAAMTGKLAAGSTSVSCPGSVTGAICAALSVRTQPTTDRPSGQALGTLKYQATIDSAGKVTETPSISNAVKNLRNGTTPLALGSLGDAFADAGGAIAGLADESTDDHDVPLVGSDATAGSWLVPLLDAYGLELGETMMKGTLGNLPEKTPLNDVDGSGTSLSDALANAVKGAAAELTTADGETMGDVTSITPELTCGAAACTPATQTVGDVTAVELPMVLGKAKTTYQVPFESGLAGLPVAADFLVNSEVGWGLNLTVGIDRTTGPYVDLADSKLALDAGVTFPTPDEYAGSDGCPANPVSSAFDAGSPFAGYHKESCQSLTLGLLQATAYDGKGDDRSQATVDLDVDLDQAINGTATAIAAGDLKDLSTSEKLDRAGVSLKAKGRLNVYFVTGINPRNGSPDAALPSVHGVLDMKFNPTNKNVWDVTNLDEDWSIDYEKLYLDAGTFVDKFAGDVIRGAAKQVKPYKPLIDAVRAPVPVISDIAMLMGQEQVSLLDILEGSVGANLGFVRKVIEVLDVVSSITEVGSNVLIPLGASEVPAYDPVKIDLGVDLPIPDVTGAGSFKAKPKQSKSGPCGGTMTLNKNPQAGGANGVAASGTQQSPQATKTERRMPKDCSSTDKGGGVLRGSTKVIQTQKCDPSGGCTGKERAATITKALNKPKLTGTAITFPFMEDFSEVFGLLMGEDATLVRLDLGTLRASAGIGLKFGPFMAGPVPVDIGVGLSVTFGAHLALGYDTLGIRNALLNNPGEFDPSAMLDGLYIDDYDAAGNETPEMTLTLAVQLEGSVSIKIFRVGIYGGVSITIAGDLNDPNQDGKLRIKEIRAVDNPICLFELSGWLDFFFGFFVEVDLFIKTFRYDVELYRLKPALKLFEIKCEPKPPVLAVEAGGHLRLKMGETHKAGRNISEDEPKERFKLRQLTEKGAAKDGGTLVSVEAFGIYQEHLVPAGGRIVADAGSADDTVELSAGVDLANKTHLFTVPATVNGGPGNDAITTGLGDDVVNGGDGNDRIAGNDGIDTLNGDGNDDIVSGGLGNDVIGGGSGKDNLSGDNGGDTVDGGSEDDQITGGPGLSPGELTKLTGRWVKAGKKGPEPSEALLDRADTLSGGSGNDRITGHVGDDVIFGDEPVAGDFRDRACADGGGTGTGLDVVDGQTGNDWIAGGPSDDSLTGGQGDDTLCGNGGDDDLEGDEGPSATGSGQDELRGGDGNDRISGRGGRDYADGGPGADMIATGAGEDVALGGTGSDAVNAGGEGDIVLGDGGTVTGVIFNSSDVSTVAGVKGTGLDATTVGKDLESKVSGHDASSSTAGSMTSCLARVILLKGAGTGPQGRVDLNGDGIVDTNDDGRLDGYPVIDGKVDVDRDGNVTGDVDDAGVVADRVVNAGLFDIPVDMAIDALAWNGDGHADCLFGQDGNDAVFGGAGGDRIAEGLGDGLAVGGADDDTVRGEDGTDLVRGSDGKDTLFGDAGDDTMLGNSGDDTAYGGTGSDQVEGNEDADTLYGGEAADALVGGTTGAGAADTGDTLYGGEDADFIAGDNAVPVRTAGVLVGLQLEDVTSGGAAGADRVFAGTGADRVYGQGGQDVIRGEGDADDIEGGPDHDTIHGDDGTDTVTGGSGVDLEDGKQRTWERTPDTGDELYGDAGNDTLLGDNGIASTRTLFDVPSGGTDPSTAAAGADVIRGGSENDRLLGQSGNDSLFGDAGLDVIDGNSGADTLEGGDDADVLVGGSQQAKEPTISGAGVDDRDRTPAGETRARGDLIRGDAGDDVVLGDNGRVTGFGATALVEEYDVWWASVTSAAPNASGADQLYGDSGRDRMFGQNQNDLMSGGDDDDAMAGDSGADSMSGNGGADDIVGGSGLAQAPAKLSGVRDDGDTIFGGDAANGSDSADVILGDNGRITRSGTDPNTGRAARSTVLYDLAVVGGALPSTLVSGSDVIRGNNERDLVYGQGAADTIAGDAGDDWLEGNTNPAGSSGSPDVIRGGDGDDDALGGSSNNVVVDGTLGPIGEAGKGTFPTTPNKVLDGRDQLWGDAGNDAVLGDNGRVDRLLSGGLWRYQSYKGSGETVTAPLLVRSVVGARADEGTGSWGDDEGHGGDGHDELYGQLGADRFEGNAGDDALLGDLGEVVTSVRTGPAVLKEADGFIQETINVPGTLKRTTTTYPVPTSVTSGGVGGNDVLLGGLGNDVTHGGAGDDQVWGNRSFDSDLVPTKETIAPTGTSGLDDDVLFGGHGADRVWGGWQHDRMYGGHGADQLDMVTVLNGVATGDKTVDFKGIDFMYGGWGADGMQADVSKPSPSNQTDKMVDATGVYNGYFVCEGAYGGNSIMRLLSPSMESFWQSVAADDGLVSAGSSNTSGWWELGMVYNKDRGQNANPTYPITPAHFVCDN